MAAPSNSLHVPRACLSEDTLHLHHAIVSLMEELQAVNWYRQRADNCEDEELRSILLHNMRREMQHAVMDLELIRRKCSDFDGCLRAFLFNETDDGNAAADRDAAIHARRIGPPSHGSVSMPSLRGPRNPRGTPAGCRRSPPAGRPG